MAGQLRVPTPLLRSGQESYRYAPLQQAAQEFGSELTLLPYAIRVLLESALRARMLGRGSREDIRVLAEWNLNDHEHGSFSFTPARILLQDLTGVPLIVDLASLREEAARRGKDPQRINPLIPVDLVIDHSLQVDAYGTSDALVRNTELEYQRNLERYQFLKWAQGSIRNLRVIPPASGIVHQVNLEYLAPVIMEQRIAGEAWAYPDTVYGTDSHTTMVSGLGVLGWGVGGIEAAAAMLGEPVETLVPDVVGVRVTGSLPEGSSPTDAVLTLTRLLRQVGVVDKLVEFFGPGLDHLSVPDRAMLANMAPEYGATSAFFPVDQNVLEYLALTGREPRQVELVRDYATAQGLFRTASSPVPHYTRTVELALDQVVPALAGPKRPQDLVKLGDVSRGFQEALLRPKSERGFGLRSKETTSGKAAVLQGEEVPHSHGLLALAAITSCTNTSNPTALVAAGLLARKARQLGLSTRPWVKTSFAPGSRAVTAYLEAAGLMEDLQALGFHLVGYGCSTCIGNSGPLLPEVERTIQENGLVAAAVLSGNRNFEGRVHPLVQANYLASPALVVAFAILGTVARNLAASALGKNADGRDLYLSDIWPTSAEIGAVIAQVVRPEIYRRSYARISEGDAHWQAVGSRDSLLYPWDPASLYIRESPFCSLPARDWKLPLQARILAILGDSVTTDHISPAGSIAIASAAGRFLAAAGVAGMDFNSYGSRRGNHEIMVRATFANPRLLNRMLADQEGSLTRLHPSGEVTDIFSAAQQYRQDGVELVVVAGKDYGTGSSRDWAAKGPLLLGVRAVLAESFERIHRSNLVGMGILPLRFQTGENAGTLGLTGAEVLTVSGLEQVAPMGPLTLQVQREDGTACETRVTADFHSPAEITLWRAGGILPSFSKTV